MFLKIFPKKYPNGKITFFAAFVESYWDPIKKYSTQRIVKKIGMVSKEQAELLKIVFNSKSNYSDLLELLNKPATISIGRAYNAGHSFLLSEIWNKLKLSKCIDKNAKNSFKFKVSEIIKLMVINRCIFPCTEYYLSKWYNSFSDGIRLFIPLNGKELHYRCLYRYTEEVARIFPKILKYLYKVIKKNIHKNKRPDCLYYDITSTYFEGKHICILAQFGYSRDKRTDKKQIILALITDEFGFPIYAEVLPGNTADKSTVKEIIKKIKRLYKIKNCIIIGDRGMISEDNFQEIVKNEFDYLMALDKNHIKSALSEEYEKISRLKNNEQIIIRKEKRSYLIYFNEEKRIIEQEERKKKIKKIEERLAFLKDKYLKQHKKYNSYDKLTYWLGKMDGEYSCENYYSHWIDKETNRFSYKILEDKIRELEKWDGYFVLESSKVDGITENSINIYKGLSIIEQAFKKMKTELNIRPIHHRTERTIKGHIYIVVIAYFIEKYIEWNIRTKLKINTNISTIIKELEQIKIVEKKVNGKFFSYELSEYEAELDKIFDCFNSVPSKMLKNLGK